MENPSIESGTSHAKPVLYHLGLFPFVMKWDSRASECYETKEFTEIPNVMKCLNVHDPVVVVTELNLVENYTFIWKLSFAFDFHVY